ncbi:MAG TPA: elongation factor P hydroxylase [Pseudomonadales bacterium]|jgi:elongation factor P hydroxylase
MRGRPVISDRAIAGRINPHIRSRYATLIVGGAREPLYQPAIGRSLAIIRYTRDYAQSVLHEVAHWCLADGERRLLEDYGYWYLPPPRTPEQQAAFFAAEERVQALESLLAAACGLRFHVSADQPGTEVGAFAASVRRRAARWRETGLTGRAAEIHGLLGRPW